MKDVEILEEPIELYKLLKMEGMASSGGEAKSFVAQGLVSVNGEVETRKRKKIVSGDVITYGDTEIRVKFSARELTK